MKAWDRRTLIEDALARAVDDWVHVADFIAIARRTQLDSPEALRALALGLIVELLAKGMVVAGDADELGFHPWEIAPEDAILRVVESWSEDDVSPTPGSVAWFTTTSTGKRIGRDVLAREASE